MLERVRQGKTKLERILERVVQMPSGCWEWQGPLLPSGHGQLGCCENGRKYRINAHMALAGRPPSGFVWHHKCHNPACIRPDHLELLTPSAHSKIHVKRCQHGDTDRVPGGACRICDRENTRRRRADPAYRERENELARKRRLTAGSSLAGGY